MGNDLRVVAFPEAGDGVEFVLRNKDLRDLQAALGDDYLEHATMRLEKFDMVWMSTYLRVCLKKDGKRFIDKNADEVIDAFMDKMTIHDVRERIYDGIQLSVSGETWAEFQNRIAARIAAAQMGPDGPLLSSPGTSSSTSETGPSEQVLNPPNSGN